MVLTPDRIREYVDGSLITHFFTVIFLDGFVTSLFVNSGFYSWTAILVDGHSLDIPHIIS